MLDISSVSVVMIRSLAILVIVNAISAIPAALTFVRQEPYPDGSSPSPNFAMALALVTYLLLAAILLIFAKKFGLLLTRDLENTSLQVDEPNYRVLQAVAFSVLGAYVLVYAIPALVKMIAIAVLPVVRDEDGGFLWSAGRRRIPVEDVVQELAQLALGLWLLLGRNRVVVSMRSMWKRSRSMWKRSLSADSPE